MAKQTFKVLRAAGILCASLLAAANAPVNAQEPHEPIDILLQQKVSAEDGTPLAVTVWKPRAKDQQYPTVLVVTPYVSDEAQQRGRTYADRGYATASLDTRGRGASGGTAEPLRDHGSDACAAIRWIKAQPWSDGRVAMRGGSYRGMTQWMAARACADEIATIIPTAAVYPGHDYPSTGGHRFWAYNAQWNAFVSGPTRNMNLFLDEQYWNEKARDAHRAHLPFHQYDIFVGAPSPAFQEWLARMAEPRIWEQAAFTPQDYAAMDMPVLTITGHFDGDQPGALRYYREHQEHASREAQRQHYLVMGPWTHAGTRVPVRSLSGIDFGSDSVFDMDQFNLDWLDWRLQKGKKPDLLEKRVAYFVGGANEWRFADDLESVNQEPRRFYLSAAENEAYDVFRAGRLVDTVQDEEATHSFTNDPLDTSNADRGEVMLSDIWSSDITKPLPAFLPETLVFHTAPLKEDMVLAGHIKATLFLSMDTPDTDILTTVYAVMPDGQTRHLGADVVRARFRGGLDPQLVEPGKIEQYDFDKMFWTAWALPAGTRLRLTVGPFNDPGHQKNYNSGGRPGFETVEDARVATVTLHHDAKHPSALEIPLARSE